MPEKCPLAEFNLFSCFSALGALKYSLKIDSDHAECVVSIIYTVHFATSAADRQDNDNEKLYMEL